MPLSTAVNRETNKRYKSNIKLLRITSGGRLADQAAMFKRGRGVENRYLRVTNPISGYSGRELNPATLPPLHHALDISPVNDVIGHSWVRLLGSSHLPFYRGKFYIF